jgi:hypothetical protein
MAKARIHFSRVRKDRMMLDKRLSEPQAGETQWTDRARRIASMDESRALECVRRIGAGEWRHFPRIEVTADSPQAPKLPTAPLS